ncbi:MAG: cytochrome b N-terminal domain-containing protein [Mariprofundaceae bacterium]|nr:cytochrome b N-terminal domain-containing protein [Mariprofundaceae bacterium]
MTRKRGKLYRWLDERLALSALSDFFLNEPMPGGASVWYVFGSGLVFVLIMQVITGILLLFYYAPTMDHAWESIRYLMEEVPFGSFIRGLHHWGASMMVVVVVLHVTQVFIWGAYKRPRELTWLAGLASFATVMGFAWTGYLLPWDQLSYWGTMVGTEIIGTIPVIGEAVATFIKGGGSIGAQTLSRFFAMHIWILPAMLFMAVTLHLYLFRKQGVAGPFSGDAASLEQKKSFFFPRQFFIDVLFALFLYLILVALAIYFAPVLRSPANPAVSPAHVAPEWYFLFLYELLKYFPQDLIVVGTVVIPGLMAILLIGLPFYNRDPERHPYKRWRAITVYFTGLALIAGLTIMAIRSAPETLHKVPALIAEGKRIYQKSNCAACHQIHGTGGDMGPDLSYEGLSGRSPDWIRGHFRNPAAFVKGSAMPGAQQLGLSEDDIEALTHYMFSLE